MDTIRISGVGTQGISYSSRTGMVFIDGKKAIDIGEGKDIQSEDIQNLGDSEWEIF